MTTTPAQRLLVEHVSEYGNLRTPISADSVATILKRYAVVWASPSAFAPQGAEPSVDGVATLINGAPPAKTLIGYHSYTKPAGRGPWDHVRRLAALPELARLNYVRQLSTTSISLNIEATHNRLAHLLGTLDVCGAMLQEGCCNAPDSSLPTAQEATACLLLALLHDLYHGPFGHSLDRISDLVFQGAESRIDKGLLIEQVSETQRRTGLLWRLIEAVADWAANDRDEWRLKLSPGNSRRRTKAQWADEMADFFGILVARKETLAKTSPDKYWLRELVDGPLDADRLDYLARDSYFLHRRSTVNPSVLQDLIQGIRIGSGTVGIVDVDEQTGQGSQSALRVKRVQWAIQSQEIVEELLGLRTDLYREIYEAPQKRSFDEMLAHALVWTVRDAVGESDPSALANCLRAVASVTDDELFHFFYEVAARPLQPLALAIVHDLAVGRKFPAVWKLDIPNRHLEDAQKRHDQLADAWELEALELAKERRKTRLIPIEQDRALLLRLKRHFDLEDENTVFAFAYFIEQLHGRHFASREILERALWAALLDGGGDPRIKTLVEDELADLFGRIVPTGQDTPESIRRFIASTNRTPLIFLSIPWAPRPADFAELSNWEPQDEVPFHEKGEATDAATDIGMKMRQRFYPILAYLPESFARHSEIRDLVDRLMFSLLDSALWYLPTEAAKGFDWVRSTTPDYWKGRYQLDL